MARYVKKPIAVEALTFAELFEIGLASAPEVDEGVPVEFDYGGYLIKSQTAKIFLIPTLRGEQKMHEGDMLIIGTDGELYPTTGDIFRKEYALVGE